MFITSQTSAPDARAKAADPRWIEEFGYGLGRPDGIVVLKYTCDGLVDVGSGRQDFLHQLYWTPDGTLSTLAGQQSQFIGPNEAFWAERGASHDVRALGRQTTYRICLREAPAALAGLRSGAVSISATAADLVQRLCGPGVSERTALADRAELLGGLSPSDEGYAAHHAIGAGFAMTVARTLSHDPGDATPIDEWAERLHISVKTLQRDFEREFMMSFSQWRTELRLRIARVLLEVQPVGEVAYRVGYATPSAFVAAFAKKFGCTPGQYAKRAAEASLTPPLAG